jgi:hypothetical protein
MVIWNGHMVIKRGSSLSSAAPWLQSSGNPTEMLVPAAAI